MSSVVSFKGTVKELYPDVETLREKIELLSKDIKVELSDLIMDDISDISNDEVYWAGSYDDEYMIINGRLFDISATNYEYEPDEYYDNLSKTGKDTYAVDFLYYNGGTDFTEIFSEKLEKADSDYDSLHKRVYTEANNKTMLRVTYENEETGDIKVIENSLGHWLSDDDGGNYGLEQGYRQIGQEVYNDPESGFSYTAIKIEVKL